MKELTNNAIAERILIIDKAQKQDYIDGVINPILMKRKNNLISIGLKRGFVEVSSNLLQNAKQF